MANLCNLDGVIAPETETRVPVLDRGFLFGDSVYEVIRTMGGAPFAWAEHLDRLWQSAAGIRMTLDLERRQVMQRMLDTLTRAGNAESYIRIVVSRGTGSAPNIDLSHAPANPCWLVMVRALAPIDGVPVHLARVDRLRNDRRALDPAVKSGNYLNNVLGLAEARDRGATDCLFLNAQGHVTEASTSNVFAVVDGTVCTPPLDSGILAGVTRAMLVDWCRGQGMQVAERNLTAAEFAAADEAFLSSTLRSVSPVLSLDGKPFGNGTEGPVTAHVRRGFDAWCREVALPQQQHELQALLA